MSALVVLALLLVAAGGAAVVLTREPGRQALTLGMYGMLLAVLFTVLQAPDVALSQLAVGTVVTPLMVLLAIRKVRADATEAEGAADHDADGPSADDADVAG